ncbi:FtsX-like permease family protein [Bacillus sp. S/N-304-OC-R1]|uniref:ABC transporter permease n=1 Tax=Bacillus sp. S/N-304-OC-R1 TaxID=2758034 RepID=UPI001C8DFEF5|nr:FtsX-like permease family protein [Bacillus sp. S/N-304-OC-R1]MBY0122816.1 FtsX-like permease family protein [Bacillus sp. S/N-304-OC-R1]
MRNYILQITAKLIWRNKRKSFFALMAVAFGVNLLVSVYMLYEKMDQSIKQDLFQRYGSTDMLVGYRLNKLLEEEQITNIKTTDGVLDSSNILVNPQKFSNEYNGLWNGVYYVGVENSELSKSYYKFTKDLGQNEVIISQKLANKLGAAAGKNVNIIFPSGKSQTWKLKEIISEQSSPGSPAMAIFHLESLQSALGLEKKVNLLLIDLKDGVKANEIKYQLRNDIDSALDIDIISEYDAVKANINNLAVIGITLGILSIFISILFVLSHFQLAIRQKEKELAVLRAIGATKKHLFQMILFEAIMINTVGILLGLITGIFLSNLLSGYTAKLLHIPVITSPIPFMSLLLLSTIIWFILLMASLSPAYKAAKILPMQTRLVRMDKPEKPFLKRNWLFAFFMGMGILSLLIGVWLSNKSDSPLHAILALAGGFVIALSISLSAKYVLGMVLKSIEYVFLYINAPKILLAVKNFAVDKKQKTGVILLLSSTIAFVFVSSSILHTLKQGAEKTAREQYISDLLLISDLNMQSSIHYDIELELESMQEIKAAIPLSVDYGGWVNDDKYINYIISDIHKLAKAGMIKIEKTVDLSRTVLIPVSYAKSIHLQNGDAITVTLDEGKQTSILNVLTIDKIPGVLNQERLLFDHSNELVQKVKDIRIQKLFVDLERGMTKPVIQQIETLKVQYPELSWGDLQSELQKINSQVNQRFGIVLVFQFIIGIVGVFGLINVFSAMIHHNRKEYAILRAIYLTPRDLLMFLITQGMLICWMAAFIGTICGCILSIAFAVSLNAPFQISTDGIWGITIVFLIGFLVSWGYAVKIKNNTVIKELTLE